MGMYGFNSVVYCRVPRSWHSRYKRFLSRDCRCHGVSFWPIRLFLTVPPTIPPFPLTRPSPGCGVSFHCLFSPSTLVSVFSAPCLCSSSYLSLATSPPTSLPSLLHSSVMEIVLMSCTPPAALGNHKHLLFDYTFSPPWNSRARRRCSALRSGK